MSLWTTSGEREIQIIADFWREVGLSTNLNVLGEALTRDIRLRASYPAFDYTRLPLAIDNLLRRTYSPQCPSESNRWIGNNRGCYRNAATDQVIERLFVSIDPGEQRTLFRELVQTQTQDLPLLPLFFDVSAWIMREGITGPRLSSEKGSLLWNVREWDSG